MTASTVSARSATFSNALPFALIAGPCQMESRDHAMMIAERMKRITSDLGIPYVFKASFDKANRTSLTGKRGIGLVTIVHPTHIARRAVCGAAALHPPRRPHCDHLLPP